ncbi:hypothetical protein EDD18DRAFT_1112420 [Armillaria luteobubalina]|uniref:Uncharacterized protein n=1 Tax=Armillaria luteobubalina TaxID=153913 RepID=A0AA39PGL5_9AGAR|nr:hypothetical protein EDD18DRAFT_1112420 [Armillaria luteobubalina]
MSLFCLECWICVMLQFPVTVFSRQSSILLMLSRVLRTPLTWNFIWGLLLAHNIFKHGKPDIIELMHHLLDEFKLECVCVILIHEPEVDREDNILEKEAVISTNFLEQDNTMWEVYYSAGTVAIVLVIICIVVGRFLWCRMQNKRTLAADEHQEEESIPHSASMVNKNSNTGLNLPTA